MTRRETTTRQAAMTAPGKRQSPGPGQVNGNNLNLNGGLWHEVHVSR
jgi:hypothetical protein